MARKKKNEKGVRTGRKIYEKEVEERKTIFPKDSPTVVRVRRNTSDNKTLKSTLMFVEIGVSACQLHATSRSAVTALLISGPCHVAGTHSASNCKIHSDAKYRTCGFCRNSIRAGYLGYT